MFEDAEALRAERIEIIPGVVNAVRKVGEEVCERWWSSCRCQIYAESRKGAWSGPRGNAVMPCLTVMKVFFFKFRVFFGKRFGSLY